MDNLQYRSEYLVKVFERNNIPKYSNILEIGCGDGRNLNTLRETGYNLLLGIDKECGTPLEKFYWNIAFDVVFTMSCLFLIPDEETVRKAANFTARWLITIEGETTKGKVTGRNYKELFEPIGFKQVDYEDKVFNEFGVLRVFKRII